MIRALLAALFQPSYKARQQALALQDQVTLLERQKAEALIRRAQLSGAADRVGTEYEGGFDSNALEDQPIYDQTWRMQ